MRPPTALRRDHRNSAARSWFRPPWLSRTRWLTHALGTGTPRRRLNLEQLEPRCLLSGQPFSGIPEWVEQGPAYISGGNGKSMAWGACQTVAVHPTDANVLYVGSVNGGIWKTTTARYSPNDGMDNNGNGTVDEEGELPSWKPLIDDRPGLSIGAIAFDLSDVTHQTLYVGNAKTSSIELSGPRLGLLRTTDGGANWTELGRATFQDRNVRAIVATGQTLVVATSAGVLRSGNGGGDGSWAFAQGPNGPLTGNATALVVDTTNTQRLYAAIVGRGIFRSTNGGGQWELINPPLPYTLLQSPWITLSLHANAAKGTNMLYAGAMGADGELAALYRSPDAGANWYGIGNLPGVDWRGGQLAAMTADPNNADVVVVAGVSDPWRGEFADGQWSWTALANGTNSNNTFSHADRRSLTFDRDLNLLQTDDGGIYRLRTPHTSARRWEPMAGGLAITEINSLAYDPLNDLIFAGTQDNGSIVQNAPGDAMFRDITGNDGGQVGIAVEPSTVTRYYASNNFVAYYRGRYDAQNQPVEQPKHLVFASDSSPNDAWSGLNDPDRETAKSGDYAPSYVSWPVNAADPSRLAVLGFHGLYESRNRGDTVTEITVPGFTVDQYFSNTPIDSLADADVLLAPSMASQINYSDVPGWGHFGGDAAFPGGNDDDFVVRATATLDVSDIQAGDWTFGINSDDGCRLLVDGRRVVELDGVHPATDAMGTICLSQGQHKLDLLYFDHLFGATVELFAAPGTHTAFGPAFRLIGAGPGEGLRVTPAGFTVQQRASNSVVTTLAEAAAVLASKQAAAVNYSDTPGGAQGHFSADAAFPLGDGDDFVVRATADFDISEAQAGQWTFGVNSDDGCRLRIDGNTVLTNDAIHPPLDTFGTISLAKGKHTLELVFFEGWGGATVELFAGKGSYTAFDSNLRLVTYGNGPGLHVTHGMGTRIYTVAYGGKIGTVPYPDVMYVGSVDFDANPDDMQIWLRSGPGGGDAFTRLTSYPGHIPQQVAMDPGDWRTAYVLDQHGRIWMTVNAGVSWTELTEDRDAVRSLPRLLQSIEVLRIGGTPVLLAAGQGGVYRRINPAIGNNSTSWTEFGRGLPNAVATDLYYDPTDKVLLVGTAGRGIWKMSNADAYLGVANTLTINGDEGFGPTDDVIALRPNAANPIRMDVVVNNGGSICWPDTYFVYSVDFSVLENVVVNGLTGNDIITIDKLPDNVNLTINGGTGDDIINVQLDDSNGIPRPMTAWLDEWVNGGDGSDWIVVRPSAWSTVRVDGGAPAAPCPPGTSGDTLNVLAAPLAYFVTPGAEPDEGSVRVIPCRPVLFDKIEQLAIDASLLPGDRFEPNDDYLHPTNLGGGPTTQLALSIHEPNNEDWYQWTPAVDGTVCVDLRFARYLGDLRFALFELVGGNANIINVSSSGTDREYLAANVLGNRTYLIDVFGWGTATNPNYTLEIGWPFGVLPDDYEPNDSLATAWDLGVGDRGLTRLIGLTVHLQSEFVANEDWFKWKATAPGPFTARINFLNALGNLNLELYNSSGGLLDSSNTTEDQEEVSYSVVPGSTYYIRVVGYNGAVNSHYDLTIDVPVIAPDVFEPNQTYDTAAYLGMGAKSIPGLTVHQPDDMDWFRWKASHTGTVDVDIFFSHALGDLQLRFYGPDGGLLASSTGSGDSEHVSVPVEAGQRYSFVVFGWNQATNYDYRLEVAWPFPVPLDAFEPNESLAQASNLGGGDQTLRELTVHRIPHGPPSDDWYQWTAWGEGTLGVRLTSPSGAANLDLELYDAWGTLIAWSYWPTTREYLSKSVLVGRSYFIRVFSQDGDVNPDYTLEIDGPDIPADFFEPDNTLFEAFDLGMGDQTCDFLTIHAPNNDDWFRWTAPEYGVLNVDIAFSQNLGNLDLELYDANRVLCAVSDIGANGEHVDQAVTPGDIFYLRVFGHSGDVQPAYTLTIDGPDIPPDAFEPNDSFAGAFPLPSQSIARDGLTIHAPNNDDWFSWTAPGPGAIRVDLTFVHAFGDVDLELYDDQQGLLDSSTSLTDSESVGCQVEAGRTYYFRAYGAQIGQVFERVMGPEVDLFNTALQRNYSMDLLYARSEANLPNLTPYQPAGWSDKIVVSNQTGTHTDAPLFQTDTLYVDWAIINNGTGGTAATYYVELYLDDALRASWEPANLGPGASWQHDDFAIGGGLAAGQHTLRIVIDRTGAIAETSETDNEYTKTIFVSAQALPNLAPYRPAGWPDKIVVSSQPGTHTDDSPLLVTEPFYVDWSVINNGGAVAPAPFWTRVYVDDVVRFEDRVDDPLQPGAYLLREDLACAIGGLTPGEHTIKIVTDAFDAISESNETDNEYTKTVFFSAATLPNLAPYQPAGWYDKIVVSNQTGTHTEDVVLAGSPFYVDFGLINDGSAGTGTGFGVMLYLDGLSFGGGTQSALSAGEGRALEDIPLGPLTAGPHFLRIVLDSSSEVTEGNETDNEYQRLFMVVEPTSITVVEDAVPDHPQDFSFVGPLVDSFLLDDDTEGTLPRMRTFDGMEPNVYFIMQDPVADWELADIVIAGDLDGGSSIDVANRTAQLDLDAGENLTVTFTNRLVTAPVRVWDGHSIGSPDPWDDHWSNPQNWTGDAAPLPGDRLEFPEAALQKSLHNDFVGASFGQIALSGGAYSIAPLVPGTVTGLSGGIVNTATASTDNTIGFDIRLDNTQAMSNDRPDHKLSVTGSVDTGGWNLVLGGPGPIDLGSGTSSITGSGMLFKTGDGAVTLRGNNRYTGGTVVNQGTLIVASVGALPPGGSLTIGTEDSEGATATVVLASGLSVGVAVNASGIAEPGACVAIASAEAEPGERPSAPQSAQSGAPPSRPPSDASWFTLKPLLPELLACGAEFAEWKFSANDFRPKRTFNIDAADTTNSDQLWAGGGLSLNLNGAGYTVGVWDEGSIRATHQEFTTPAGSRVTVQDGAAPADHSTHVGGTIGASGVQAGARGIVNQVNLWSYNWTNDLTEMASAASTIAVSNHSYGTDCGWDVTQVGGVNSGVWWGNRAASNEDNKFGKYTSDARDMDTTLSSHPNLLAVQSAGNDHNENHAAWNTQYWTEISGVWRWVQVNDPVYPAPPADGSHDGGFDCLPPEATAKNSLVVGAVFDVIGDPYTSPQVVATGFSSFGPTDDGRIKPDVVANGDRLFSTVAFLPGTNPPAASNSSYDTYEGTSMAAPNVTGTAVQLIEHYEDLFGARPRSATTKGIIIHTAFDAGRTGPDYEYGWGLVDAARAANFITGARDQGSRDRIVEGTYTGSEFTQELVSDGARPLKATIVWTDPAGTAADTVLDSSTPVLVNDLDLWVTGPGGTYYPWTLDRTNPNSPAVRTRNVNHLDNVEQVLIDAPAAGTYTVHVGHTGNTFTQAFSLLVSGGLRPTDFGDAAPGIPVGYPVTLADNGARHLIGSGLYLGSMPPDAEGDGFPDGDALGDDNNGTDDEDGVTVPPLRAGEVAYIQAFVIDTVPNEPVRFLSGWIDWNRDCDWDDPNEQICSNWVLPNQPWVVPVSVPQNASHGTTYARFRLSRDPGLKPYGLSTTGEVEDYRVFVQGWGPDLSGFDCVTLSGTIDWGESFTLRARVKNHGTVPVTEDFRQQFFLSPNLVWGDGDEVYRGQYLHTADVPANDVGPLFEVTLTLPSEAPPGFCGTGPFYIGMTTDALNNVAETDDGNNFPGTNGLWYDFSRHYAPEYYDLRGRDCRVPATIDWGETFTLQGRVRNDGTLPVGADFQQQFFLGADEVWGNGEEHFLGEYVHIDDVPANSTGPWFNVTLTLPDLARLPPVFGGPGPFYIGMSTDARNQVAERNEADNLPGSCGWLYDYDSFSLHNNDDFAYRFDLASAASVTDTATNTWYTGERFEPAQSGNLHSAWWSWTAPSEGLLTIDTFGSSFDTFLTLATGTTLDALTIETQNDDSGGPQSRIAWTVTAGTQYQIAVDGRMSDTGNIMLNLSFSAGAPNLAPFKPFRWPDKLVVSNRPGTHADDSVLSANVYVDWSVVNDGTAPALSPFLNRVYVDGSLQLEDQFNEWLQPGAYLSRDDLAIGGLAPGQHTITIVTDAGGAVSEGDETDNEYSKTIFVSEPLRPNLTLHQPAGWPDKITVSNQPGTHTDDSPLSEIIYVDWSVINNGNAAAQPPFWTRVYVDGTVRFEDRMDDPLPPDTVVTREDLAMGLPPGEHTIRIVTDASGAISESDENDNEYTKTIFISAPSLPNLAPHQPAGWADKIVVSNQPGTHADAATLDQSDALYIDWAVINNGSEATAAAYSVELYLDGTLRGSWEPPSLVPGESWYLEDFSIGGGMTPGQHSLTIVVDSGCAILETNEADNHYTKTFLVTTQALPNLTPHQPAGWADKIVVSSQPGTHTDDSPLSVTEPFYVDWSVINDGGTVAQAPFLTRVYVDGVLRFEDQLTESLAPGEKVSREDLAVAIGGLTPGQHTIRIVTDALGQVAESNEGDNDYTKTSLFSAQALPNLTPYQPAGWPDKIVVSSQPGTHTEDVVLAGSPFYVDFGLINDGPAGTGTDFGVVLYLDGLPFGGGTQSALSAGESRTLEDVTLGPLTAGFHLLRIVLDPSSEVTESNETDNEYQRMFVVVEQTSITVVEDAVPDHPQDFSFVGPLVDSFLLDDDTDPTLPRMRMFDGMEPNVYFIIQDPVADWELADIVIAGDLDGGSNIDVANRTAHLDLDAGENLTVTFVNRLISAPARVWDGHSIASPDPWDDHWSNPQNWTDNLPPLPGDRLEFPEAALQKSLHNDFVGASFGQIALSGGGYSMAPLVPGTVTGLSGGIVNMDTASANNTIGFDIRLDNTQPVSNDRPDHTLSVTGSVDTGGWNLVLAGPGPIDLGSGTSSITGSGMLFKTGEGAVTLRGNNRYTGGTVVNQGTLIVASVGALPPGRSLTIGTEDSEGAVATVVLASGLSVGVQAQTPVRSVTPAGALAASQMVARDGGQTSQSVTDEPLVASPAPVTLVVASGALRAEAVAAVPAATSPTAAAAPAANALKPAGRPTAIDVSLADAAFWAWSDADQHAKSAGPARSDAPRDRDAAILLFLASDSLSA